MTGRYIKKDVSNINFTSGGGIYCNNDNQEKVFEFCKKNYGKPNGESHTGPETSWKYILEYENYFITVYNFYDKWSIGFLEKENSIVDYGKVFALAKMFLDYIKKEVFNEKIIPKSTSRRRMKVGR